VTALALIDAGGANLGSVRYALERLGVQARIVRDADGLGDAERIILPGVGAAAPAMARLHERGLGEPLRTTLAPVLGPLHGVPITIKSSIDVAGLACEAGTRLRQGYVAEADAPPGVSSAADRARAAQQGRDLALGLDEARQAGAGSLAQRRVPALPGSGLGRGAGLFIGLVEEGVGRGATRRRAAGAHLARLAGFPRLTHRSQPDVGLRSGVEALAAAVGGAIAAVTSITASTTPTPEPESPHVHLLFE